MSDYTPPTEEVQFAWKFMRYQQGAENYGEIANAEFDRWLAEVKAQEREHVIKKLAAHALDRTILTAIVDLIEGEEQ